MKCLTCPDTTLAITERSGVEIDYCPTCRSVWLDRGELDKIIERSSEPSPASRREPDRDDRDTRYEGRDPRDDRERFRDHDRAPAGRRKKESFLGDLFDF